MRECEGAREQTEGVIVRVRRSNTGSECDGETGSDGEGMREKTQEGCVRVRV